MARRGPKPRFVDSLCANSESQALSGRGGLIEELEKRLRKYEGEAREYWLMRGACYALDVGSPKRFTQKTREALKARHVLLGGLETHREAQADYGGNLIGEREYVKAFNAIYGTHSRKQLPAGNAIDAARRAADHYKRKRRKLTDFDMEVALLEIGVGGNVTQDQHIETFIKTCESWRRELEIIQEAINAEKGDKRGLYAEKRYYWANLAAAGVDPASYVSRKWLRVNWVDRSSGDAGRPASKTPDQKKQIEEIDTLIDPAAAEAKRRREEFIKMINSL